MGIEALFAGLLLPTNDLIRERLIFQRERMLNLKVLPYLSSKVFLYSNFAVIQVLLYLIILSLGVNIPTRGLYVNGYVELFISLFLTMMAGISLGLVISAVSRSTEVATYILLATLVFQFLFAGTLFDLRGKALEPLSNLAPAHWSVTALGVTIDMHKIAQSTILCNEVHENPSDPNSTPKMVCLPAPEAKNDLFLNYSNDQLLWSWTVLIGITILCLGIGWILLARQNPSMHER
jgi:ABC-type transport system involved in multi-copper enzyme maturation permease subunit